MFFHLPLPHLGTQTSSPRWTRCTKSVSSFSQRVCRLLTAADGEGTCLRQLTVEKAMLTAEPLTHPTRKLPANERLSIKQNDGFRHYLNWVELVFCNLQPIIRVPNPQEATGVVCDLLGMGEHSRRWVVDKQSLLPIARWPLLHENSPWCQKNWGQVACNIPKTIIYFQKDLRQRNNSIIVSFNKYSLNM